MHARTLFGREGEDAASAFYRDLGYEVVERNYRSGRGEIDLVARRGETLVFCEVKSRRSDRWGAPAEAVDGLKQARLRKLAAAWMAERRPGYAEVRFDVVSVIVRDGKTDVNHIPDAF